MKQFDIDKIRSFGNDKIKNVFLEQSFAISDESVHVLAQLNIDDKNIIPVALRVHLMFPLWVGMSATEHWGEGMSMSAKIELQNIASDVLLLQYVSCSNVYSPIFEKEFYGSLSKPLSDVDNLDLMAFVYRVEPVNYTIQVFGRILIEFYYIPIRY